MDPNHFISSLENSTKKIEYLLKGVTEKQAKWKPLPEKWSILEVVNHLYDEERDDFRKRLDLTLHTPDEAWPGIDQESWVQAHEYYKKDYDQSVRNFFSERAKSLEWLKTLPDPDWERTHHHPIIGPLAAADLLAAWATHDYLHLRQLADLQARYLNIIADPFSTIYASQG